MPTNELTEYDNDHWYLAGGISRGIGRSWIMVAYGMSHVEPGDPLYMSAPSLAAGKAWLRETLAVPLRYSDHTNGRGLGFHVYCLDKYVEQVPSPGEWGDD